MGAVLVIVVLSDAIALGKRATSKNPATVVNGSFSFTAFNFPGANGTRGTGLNDHGDIVGDYRDSRGVPHGYLLSHGTFTSFDPQGSVLTRGIAINNLGVIGGHFLDNGNVRHSYLLNRGSFTIFDFPGATSTFLQGINDLRQIVGPYGDPA